MNYKLMIIAAIAGCTSASAFAVTNGAAGAHISTLGLGVEYTIPLNAQTEFGLNVNYLNYNRNYDDNDVTYDAKLKLLTFGAVGYYYPWQNSGFNLNGGLFYNGNKVTLDAQPKTRQEFEFNGHTYSTDSVQNPHGDIKLNKIAPYLGIGWKSGDRNQPGLALDANLGVMFHGTPDVSLSAKCSGELAGNTDIGKQLCRELQRDIAKERQDVQDDVAKYKFYPVASIGFTYRF